MQRMHRLGYRLFLPLLAVVLGATLAPPANAQDPAPTHLTLSGKPAYAGQQTPLHVTLTDANGDPVAGKPVAVEHRVSVGWEPVGDSLMTNDQGRITVRAELSKQSEQNVFRGRFHGDVDYSPSGSGPVKVGLRRRNSSVHLSGPDSVKDGRSLELRVQWLTGNDQPVAGAVKLYRRDGRRGDWKQVGRLRTGDDGRASVTVTPREDTWWRAQGVQQDWVRGDVSNTHAVDNIPPGIPVKLPQAAPNPRVHLPDQPFAVGNGANPVVSPIPDRVWRQMTGRTWHRGCPVGRPRLRYLRINYWDYAGYRRRGELVANADAVHQMAGALAEMYRKKLPIRAMYREDRFGWSRRLQGANDYKSMAAGNTSAFNCRRVVGNPGARSPHSYGRSLDVNTWENPYRSAQGTVPNTWWMGHSHRRVAWRSRSHPVVRVMASHGLRWTYGTGDTQHFDVRPGSGRSTSARLNAEFLGCGGVCD
jgi:hypothetical protein